MPIHDWTRVEQRVNGPEPDVIAVETGRLGKRKPKGTPSGGLALLDPPRLKLTQEIDSDASLYARKGNRISVRHHLGEVVAIIELVSPGNKDSRNAFRQFVDKATEFLRAGVHLLIIDLFPPTPRDPHGIHKAILEEFGDLPFDPPADKPRGLDIGVFQLRELYVRGLQSNGVQALAEQNWIDGDNVDSPNQYLILGFPDEEQSYDGSETVVKWVRPCLAGVTPCEPPPDAPNTEYPLFIGKLLSDEPKSIKGFSGGPIFKMKWVQPVSIQSPCQCEIAL